MMGATGMRRQSGWLVGLTSIRGARFGWVLDCRNWLDAVSACYGKSSCDHTARAAGSPLGRTFGVFGEICEAE